LEISSCTNGFGCGDPLINSAISSLPENGFSTANLVTSASCNGAGVTGLAITVNNPPSCVPSGQDPHNGDNSYVEVILAQRENNHFASMLGISTTILTARGEAKVSSGSSCVYALNSLSNIGVVTSHCGVNVETGPCPPALVTAPHIGCGPTMPADPLGYLPAPTVGGCDYPAQNITGTMPTPTLNPGTYCGGITITASNVIFNPGLYVLNGGGLSITASTVTGSGVTFYNSGSGTGVCGTCYRPVILTALSPASILTAPTSGTYEGVLFFQDRANSLAGSFGANVPLTGYLAGAYYFPDADISFSGTVDLGINSPYTIIVAQNIFFNVSLFTINNDYSSLPDGSPIKGGAVLVE
jgi:hypothetical protein